MAGMCDAAEAAGPSFWVVRKAAIVRRGIDTSSELVCELHRARLVATTDAVEHKGTMRLKMVEPCGGWVSQKVLDPVKGVALGALDARHLLEVKRAGRKGDGVFARVDLPSDVFVGEYDGEVVDEAEANARYPDGDNRFLFHIFDPAAAKDLFIDATASTHFSHWLNHSQGCYNLKTRTEYLDGAPRVAIYTSRPVEAGDELTFDYGQSYWREDDEVIEDVYGIVAAKTRRAEAAAKKKAQEPLSEAEARAEYARIFEGHQ